MWNDDWNDGSTDWGKIMSSLLKVSGWVFLSLAITAAPCLAGDAEDKLQQQVQADQAALTEEQQKLADYQAQAKWYDQFAKQRLDNAAAERAEVTKRLQALGATKAAPKSHVAQEIEALKAWLADEDQKRRQIETTREKWRAAVADMQSKISQTKYQKDADTASLEHQKELDKEKAARTAEDPKPAPPQVKQNTVLMPGFETGEGTIPTMLGPQGP